MANFLTDTTFKQTLLNYTVGNWNDKKNKTADFIAPTVRVPSVAGYYQVFSSRDAFQLIDTSKQPGQSAQVLTFKGTPTLYDCKPQALDCVIPQALLQTEDAQAAMILYQAQADYLVGTAVTNHEYQVWSKVAAAVSATSGPGAGWSTSSGSSSNNSPMSEIEQQAYAIASDIGVFPNRMVVGPNAWRYIKFAFTSKGYYSQLAVNDTPIKDYFAGVGGGIEVRIAPMAYGSNLGQSTRTNTAIVSTNDVWLFYASENPTTMDRSAFKTFQFGNGIDNIRSYVSPDQRDTYIAMDWAIDVQVANSYAVRRITAT